MEHLIRNLQRFKIEYRETSRKEIIVKVCYKLFIRVTKDSDGNYNIKDIPQYCNPFFGLIPMRLYPSIIFGSALMSLYIAIIGYLMYMDNLLIIPFSLIICIAVMIYIISALTYVIKYELMKYRIIEWIENFE